MRPHQPWRAYVYALLAVGGWATAASAFKLALRTLEAPQLLGLASLVSTLLLLLVLWAQGKGELLWQQTRVDWLLSGLQGLLNPFAYYLILLQAYDRLPAQAALALNYTWPLVLALLAVPILREPLRIKTLMALGLSLIGVILIATGGNLQILEVQDPVGVGLALGSSGIWALYWLVNLRDPRDGVVKLFLSFCFGTLLTLMLLPLLSPLRWPEGIELLLGIYVGTTEMGLTFVFWLQALQLAPNRAAIANTVYGAPFLSLVLIAVVVGEPIAVASVMGLSLILGSILWQSLPPRVTSPQA
ncbi:MAG: DMT family transporter [Synechococcaceae cyanobacterium SM2_3_1]|nr:DMT family transporter [Synechococcaceae cyanobacterium SM2_3_1]